MTTKQSMWVCKTCNIDYSGPRSLGDHYRQNPTHASTSSHHDTREKYGLGAVPPRKERIFKQNKQDRDLQLRVLDVCTKDNIDAHALAEFAGVNTNYLYRIKNHGPQKFLRNGTRVKLAKFLEEWTGKAQTIRRPTPARHNAADAPKPVLFCTACGTKVSPGWSYCGQCGAKRAML